MLYHGTSEKYLLEILNKGILPRGRRKGNWKEAPSRKNRIYLTDTYALYFATAACKAKERGLILEIDPNFLQEKQLRPDEDFIVQVLNQQGKILDNDLKKSSASMNLKRYDHLYKESLEFLGNIAYEGNIPLEAITRYALITFEPRLQIMAGDPTITTIHHQFLGKQYKELNEWIFEGATPHMGILSEGDIQKFLDDPLQEEKSKDTYRAILDQSLKQKEWFKESRTKLIEIVKIQNHALVR